jgi:hypothetical protein
MILGFGRLPGRGSSAPPSGGSSMPRQSRTFLAAALLLGLLGACQASPPSVPQFDDIRFTGRPLKIEAAGLEVRDEYKPSFQPPQVEHLFPVTPARAAANWARDRLVPADPASQRRIRATILDAGVKETSLKKSEGLRATFTTEQSERYDARVEMRVDLVGARGFAERTVTARAERSRTVPENITPNDRDKVFYELTKQVMEALDVELERQLRDNFVPYLL